MTSTYQDQIRTQHRMIEQGRQIRLREWAEEHGYVLEVEDDTFGTWYARPDSASARQMGDQTIRVVTWDD